MIDDGLWLRKILVFGSALVYWTGVFIQTCRVRRRIGRFPNVTPHGGKERILWVGWIVVLVGWMGQPLVIGNPGVPFVSPFSLLVHPVGMILGTIMIVGGYAGTLWCYKALGDAWRMGIRRREKTVLVKNGPYHFVRHPVYFFQIVLLFGTTLLLPTLFSLVLVGIDLCCVFVKALDEEDHLMRVLGPEYSAYLAATGRFLPKIGHLW